MTVDLNNFDIILHTANILALGGGLIGVLRVVVPAGISIRDALRDTAKELASLRKVTEDHEERLRQVELWDGSERRKRPRS